MRSLRIPLSKRKSCGTRKLDITGLNWVTIIPNSSILVPLSTTGEIRSFLSELMMKSGKQNNRTPTRITCPLLSPSSPVCLEEAFLALPMIFSLVWTAYQVMRRCGMLSSPWDLLKPLESMDSNRFSINEHGDSWEASLETHYGASRPLGEVFKTKYGLDFAQGNLCQTKSPTKSYIWHDIKWSFRNVVGKGLKWNLANGEACHFWEDHWVGEGPLILSHLSPNILLKMAAIRIDTEANVNDSIHWKHFASGDYDVASTYRVCAQDRIHTTPASPFFKTIWKLAVPARVKMFLWIVLKGKLVTNSEHHRRHLVPSNLCSICMRSPENLIHLFRDSEDAKKIWSPLLPSHVRLTFFRDALALWMSKNLENKYRLDRSIDDSTLFATTTSWLWKSRNAKIFYHGNAKPLTSRFVLDQA
ncbi:hypothetical protein V2J09_004905 [Rumex salicifolius]